MTLTDLAGYAGVSRSTVSLVLRKSPLVARDTRGRVEAAIEALGYVYNRGAALMRTGRSGTVGIIVNELTNPFYAELAMGIEGALDRSDCLAFLANTAESPQRQDRFIQRIREQGVDGVILSPAEGTDPRTLDELRRRGLPVVQMLRHVGRSDTDYVGVDYGLGMTLATEHLIGRGHRRIAYLGGARQTSASTERLAGYRRTLARHGLAAGPLLACPSSRALAAKAAKALLTGPGAPTALLCYNDVIALGALSGLADLGIKPGSEIAVVGFDNVPEAASNRPALTTVASLATQVGQEAAGLLLRRVGDPGGRPERVIIPPQLIVRDT